MKNRKFYIFRIKN